MSELEIKIKDLYENKGMCLYQIEQAIDCTAKDFDSAVGALGI